MQKMISSTRLAMNQGSFKAVGPKVAFRKDASKGVKIARRVSERQGSDHVPVHKELGLARDEHVPRT